MNFNKLLYKFKRRLIGENILKAMLSGVFLSSIAVLLISFVYHMISLDAPGWMLHIACPAAFSYGFVFSFIRNYPTNKKTAARIDETGLQERISTMLEFRSQNQVIHQIQRADALHHLNQTKASGLKFMPLRKELLLCLIALLAAVIITHIPYDIWKTELADTGITADQLQIIEDLIAELKEESAKLSVAPETKDTLNRMIAQLEKALKNSESDLELVAHIEDSRQHTKDTLQHYLSLYQIGEALQRYELTFALGESICFCDGNAVSAALVDIQVLLLEDNTLITTLSETINAALVDSGVASEDRLFQALNQFAMDLSNVLTTDNADDIYPALSWTIDTAEEAILAILGNQSGIESKMNQLDDILAKAKDRLLGINPDLPEYQPPQIDMPESSGGEPPEGENPDGQPEGEMPEDGEGDGEGNEEPTMIESIYDPVSGNVSYGEVFAVYYAEYLKALEAGEIPPDLQKVIDQYFSTLDQ